MIQITLDKTSDSADVHLDGDRAVIDVRSESGIGGLRAELTEGEWPEEVVIRLHLKGLERLEVGFSEYMVITSVSSTDEPAPLPTVYTISAFNEAKTMTQADSGYYPTIQIVPEEGSQPAIPLQNGYFQIGMPRNFYQGDVEAFTLQWIDFYR